MTNSPSSKSLIAFALVALAVLVAAVGLSGCGTDSQKTTSVVSASGSNLVFYGTVIRASDGDTIHVRVGDKNVTVRVLGVDTPETHDPRKPVQCYGPEASAFTKSYAIGEVTLVTEPESGDVTDRYGRTLAYVYVVSHHADLGRALLRRGFARVYAFKGRKFTKYASYLKLERFARAHRIGRWGACPE